MDSASQDLLLTLRNVLTQLPSLLTLLICLIIAIARWKRHPRVSLLASLAFVFHALHGLFFSSAYIWLPRWFFGSSDYALHRTFYDGLRLTGTFLFAVGLATLLVAVFIDRRPEGSLAETLRSR